MSETNQTPAILDPWSHPDVRPSVLVYNHAVEVANALHAKVARLEAQQQTLVAALRTIQDFAEMIAVRGDVVYMLGQIQGTAKEALAALDRETPQ